MPPLWHRPVFYAPSTRSTWPVRPLQVSTTVEVEGLAGPVVPDRLEAGEQPARDERNHSDVVRVVHRCHSLSLVRSVARPTLSPRADTTHQRSPSRAIVIGS